VADPCEQNTEPTSSMKLGEIFNWLNDRSLASQAGLCSTKLGDSVMIVNKLV
jgi:hypothetical protein